MPAPSWLTFFQRTFPSANMALIRGNQPVLVDTGFGADLAATESLLRDAGVPPEQLSLIVNTHYHCDHTGGNSGLQARYGIPVAAHAWDAAVVNGRAREACAAEWLGQPIEPYQVDRALSDGDTIDAGGIVLQVLHTPGHTLGHISLFEPESRTLICGDAVHSDDAAWLTEFREGIGAPYRALATLDRLAAMRPKWGCSGHGPALDDPLAAIDTARRRYESWLADPRKMGWHACKRILAYALMIRDGMTADEVRMYVLGSPWYDDYSRYVFDSTPEDFFEPLLAEMLRSRAAIWRDGKLVPTAPYVTPPPGWPTGPARPRDWPPVR